MKLTRRALLRTGAAANLCGATALAGCTAEAAADGYAVMYALADVTDRLAGDRLDVVNPVPTAEHGHGWSPGGDLQTRVANADLFVYLDSPEWDWARRFVRNFEEEDVDVHAVDALDGIDLLPWDEHGREGGDHADDGAHDGQEDHEEDHGEEVDGSAGEDGAAEDDHGNHQEGDHDDGHGHGEHDPHAWIDPVRMASMVDTLADALVEVDPDGEETFRSNAADLEEELGALDEAFQSAVEAADRSAVVLAGHDSFQYLTDRYGIEFLTPTGFSPDERPSDGDLVDLIEYVDRERVEYVCYDYFEGDRYASQIVADSDASEALPLSPLVSTTEEWQSEHGGFVGQMRGVNLHGVRRALGAD